MRPSYFPIDEPIGRPTVHPFGKSFGNGAVDGRFFQPSMPSERLLAATCLVAEDADDARVHEAALAWLDDALTRELGLVPPDDASRGARERYSARLAYVAEDFVLLRRGKGDGDVRALHVRAPSGWRPERTLGASLTDLHDGVPGLLERASGEVLTRMMIDRGPYVRFVWGVSTSDALDHHPDRVRRPAWEDAENAYLRVERQITVPLHAVDAALFLIRVHVYPASTLPVPVREALIRTLLALPARVRAYKGLPEDMSLVTRFFGR